MRVSVDLCGSRFTRRAMLKERPMRTLEQSSSSYVMFRSMPLNVLHPRLSDRQQPFHNLFLYEYDQGFERRLQDAESDRTAHVDSQARSFQTRLRRHSS